MFGHHETMEYSEITPYIYLGTNMCCGTHFERLTDLGITADIDLQDNRDEHERINGVDTFLWLPTPDHTAPTITQLCVGIETLKALISTKTKTYVHCQYGHGRSPTLVIAYFMSEGMSLSEAMEFVAKRRPEIHLLPAQLRGLEEFERTCKKDSE